MVNPRVTSRLSHEFKVGRGTPKHSNSMEQHGSTFSDGPSWTVYIKSVSLPILSEDMWIDWR